MKMIAMGSILALATLSAAPLMAQPSPRYNDGAGYNQDTFWRGAPSDTRSRIDFLQKRIDRGVADGSLDREEARRSQAELNNIRRDTVRMRGRMTPNGEALTQRRLDNLAQRIRWERHDGQRAYNDGRGGRDPYSTDYDASRHYRDDPRYQERRLSSNDQVYRGSDGRMYCKRSDGTTGLIIGAAGGGVLGNIIDGGHNRAAGTLIGGALGALAGKSIDQNSDVRCR